MLRREDAEDEVEEQQPLQQHKSEENGISTDFNGRASALSPSPRFLSVRPSRASSSASSGLPPMAQSMPAASSASPSASVNVSASAAESSAQQRRAERRLTRISLCIVWLFIFCHAWKLVKLRKKYKNIISPRTEKPSFFQVPTLYEGVRWFSDGGGSGGSGGGGSGAGGPGKWPEWLSLVNDISHTLIVFNSAVNFLIYICL